MPSVGKISLGICRTASTAPSPSAITQTSTVRGRRNADCTRFIASSRRNSALYEKLIVLLPWLFLDLVDPKFRRAVSLFRKQQIKFSACPREERSSCTRSCRNFAGQFIFVLALPGDDIDET